MADFRGDFAAHSRWYGQSRSGQIWDPCMAIFRETLQFTSGGMVNPGVANNGIHVWSFFRETLLLTAGGMANPGVANKGIHVRPVSGEFCSSQQVVWPIQE
jgi:hypothetical protein